VLLCASGVSFMIMLDSNIVAVSLPAIARNLGAAFTDIEWVVSAYILTFAAFLMPAGTVADRFVAGDIAGVSLEAGEASRTAMVDLARASFASGFTSLLLIAAGVAAIAALSSYRLLGARTAR